MWKKLHCLTHEHAKIKHFRLHDTLLRQRSTRLFFSDLLFYLFTDFYLYLCIYLFFWERMYNINLYCTSISTQYLWGFRSMLTISVVWISKFIPVARCPILTHVSSVAQHLHACIFALRFAIRSVVEYLEEHPPHFRFAFEPIENRCCRCSTSIIIFYFHVQVCSL